MSGIPAPTGPLITGLYVPGDRPDRFDRAVASGADLVILDLEDAVAPAAKADARSAVVAWLSSPGTARRPVVQVRINSGPEQALDLDALAPLSADIELRVPKVERGADLDPIVERMPGCSVTALLESARGIESAVEIAEHPSVLRLALGESDLASELGSRSSAVLEYARVRVLYAARAAGLEAPMMSVWPGIRDLDGLRADTERGRDLGQVGRVAVHPAQLPVIRDAFRPAEADVAWAREVVAALTGGGVSTLGNGDMVDPAMGGRAERILALAART